MLQKILCHIINTNKIMFIKKYNVIKYNDEILNLIYFLILEKFSFKLQKYI